MSALCQAAACRTGGRISRVPHFADARLEMRAFNMQAFEGGIRRMQSLDGQSTVRSSDGFPCRVSVQMVSSSPPWPRNPATERLYEVWGSAAESLGLRIKPEARGGLSDGNLLWEHVPVLDGLGPSGANAHCSERSADGSKEPEYALASTFEPKALLNYEAILRLCAAG
jgi:glutamate carboxypeptidase